MLKSIKEKLLYLIDSILPIRKDFDIVRKLSKEDIYNLPRSKSLEKDPWIHALFDYKNKTTKAIIWELKYREITLPLEYIGKIIYDDIVDLMSDILLFDGNAKFLLIPIPISRETRVLRGYNQSEYIAKSILENDLGHYLLYAPQWFEKIKDTPKQSRTQTKEERMRNLRGCFSADPRVLGKYVILIDDVTTTGSTLNEAKQTLLQRGVKNVYAFTVAH